MSKELRVAVVGCGLIGRRRALIAAKSAGTRCVVVADPDLQRASEVADASGAEAISDWKRAVERKDIDIVVASTPNGFLRDIAVTALAEGKHVLIEKPMGRNLSEAIEMRDAAHAAKRVLKIGFNHRYHPAISEAHHRFTKGEIGEIISLRARYGHGGRAGYEKEWRANKTLSGGGELTDQGVHIVDLFHWFAGVPAVAFAFLQTAVWPLGELEDNGFGLFRYGTGAVGSLHTSWTQWKNLFSLEIFGKTGALIVDGLGRSYGTETLILHQRKPEGGAPVTESWAFDQEDDSWDLEWQDFQGAVLGDAPMLGTAEDGVVAMRMIEALYRSAGTGKAETV